MGDKRAGPKLAPASQLWIRTFEFALGFRMDDFS
jgi:hypothetical protein